MDTIVVSLPPAPCLRHSVGVGRPFGALAAGPLGLGHLRTAAARHVQDCISLLSSIVENKACGLITDIQGRVAGTPRTACYGDCDRDYDWGLGLGLGLRLGLG